MSIFGIIGLTFLIGLMVFAIGILIMLLCDYLETWGVIACIVVGIAVWIAGIFIGIGLNTEYERTYIAKYEVQKSTIEMSLDSDALSGMERVQLVNKAVELNGEMAERKAMYERWHYVTYDNSLYDNVELIKFE